MKAGWTPIHPEFHTVSSHTYAAGVKVHRATSKTDLPAKELPKEEEDDHNDNDDDEASTNDFGGWRFIWQRALIAMIHLANDFRNFLKISSVQSPKILLTLSQVFNTETVI